VPNPKFVSDAAFTATINGYLSNPALILPDTIRWFTYGDDGLAVLSSRKFSLIHYHFEIQELKVQKLIN
jgi:hypothetical protein